MSTQRTKGRILADLLDDALLKTIETTLGLILIASIVGTLAGAAFVVCKVIDTIIDTTPERLLRIAYLTGFSLAVIFFISLVRVTVSFCWNRFRNNKSNERRRCV